MATPMRRSRSSTAASNSPITASLVEELRPLVDAINEISSSSRTPVTGESLRGKSEKFHWIRQILVDTPYPSQAKDAFRHLHGFQALLNTLRSVSGFYNASTLSDEDKADFFELLKIILAVLSETLNGHWGNRRYFSRRVEGDGWGSLEQALASTGVGSGSAEDGNDDTIAEAKLFGCLFAFGLGEETLSSTFRGIQRRFEGSDVSERSQKSEDHGSERDSKAGGDETSNTITGGCTKEAKIIEKELKKAFGGDGILQNPEIVKIIVNFWSAMFGSRPASDKSPRITSMSIILALHRIATSSERNLAALHATGILSTILPRQFDSALSSSETQLLGRLSSVLIQLGVSNLNDARYLYREAGSSPAVAAFLQKALESSRGPAHIQFDLSLHGFASVELANIGRAFPPTSSSAGYTFTAWIRIDKFDPDAHTTIFGAFDASQTCFVLIYIEKDTRNFILQTSITSSRPSVRFKSTKFEENRWYHVAVVHRRPRTTTSSRASLFVDGEFAEQVKCQYPSSCPPLNTSTDSFASLTSSSHRQNPVQAFLGTPQDLSSRLGRGVVLSRWSLASAHLFEEVLSDDLIAVHHQLGPRYNGNFQDCLGSFQTYEASARLNMRNELMHPGKEEKSDIVSVIRSKASGLLPESRILLSIFPTAVLSDDGFSNTDDQQLSSRLSARAAKNLYQLTRAGGNAIAINGALPSIDDALTQPHGIAILTGDLIVAIPQSLDDAIWRIGGCAAVGLHLIELARTRKTLVQAVHIFFASIKDNWRNSEAVEREGGFNVLGALLRGKMGAGTIIGPSNAASSSTIEGGAEEIALLSRELLQLVLNFVGYNEKNPEESIINNALGYRTLLVDFDMWRKAPSDTQKAYYKQFVTFGVESKYHHFNSKRLFRMRIVKKLLDALKGETFLADVLPDFMKAFKSLVSCNMSAEVLRSLSLFVTYALHKTPAPLTKASLNRRGTTKSEAGSRENIHKRPSLAIPVVKPPTPISPSSDELPRTHLGIKVLEMYSELLCNESGTSNIKKFARTVTNKWLLFLLAEDEPRVVILGAKLLARLLVVHGSSYVTKFAEKTGGFMIMRHRLKHWWNIPTIWPICFAILFDQDVGQIDFDRSFDLYNFLDTFSAKEKARIAYPEVLPVITAMIQQGLRTVVKDQDSPDSPLQGRGNRSTDPTRLDVQRPGRPRARSMDLETELASLQLQRPSADRIGGYAIVLQTVIHFLSDIHSKFSTFRDFAVSSNYVQELLFVLFPVIVSSDVVSPEAELYSRGNALTFDGSDVVIRPHSRSNQLAPPVVRTMTVEPPPSPTMQRANPLRRGSSFILVTSDKAQHSPSTARLNAIMSPKTKTAIALNVGNSIIESLLEVVIAVFTEQTLERKDFPGFGLFLKVPPGFQEHQAYFESYILRNTLSQLGTTIQLNQKILWEPRVITNISRLSSHLAEAVFEGWFLNGAEPLLDFVGTILEYLQRADISKIKSVRLCSQAVSSIRIVFLRVVLLRLSELDDSGTEDDSVAFLDRMMYWQTIILSPDTEGNFLRLICYLLYTKLISSPERIRLAAANLWRIILVQKPNETSVMLNQTMTSDQKHLLMGFRRLTELDNETFLSWIDDHRIDLDAFFFGAMSKAWEDFVSDENRRTEETAKTRVARRREKLRQWLSDDRTSEDVLHRHEIAAGHWMANIFASEHLKHQRAMQDQQDNFTFISSTFTKLDRDLRRPCGLLDDGSPRKWRLDQTEGRNRMRLRVLPDDTLRQELYRPKRKQSEAVSGSSLKIDPKMRSVSMSEAISTTPIREHSTFHGDSTLDTARTETVGEMTEEPESHEDGFEMVEDPKDDEDGFEDKNRKVMRSLQHGDQVQHVYNISRIVGLEACEGLLILGKDSLYLLDDFFQRPDGEIVNVWQAPHEERDPYVQMISGREPSDRRQHTGGSVAESRNWRWHDVISISKRRFLFRDVAIEVFFTDGRSYLLTAFSPQIRNELHSQLIARAPHVVGNQASPHPEDAWRLDALKSPEDVPQSFGSKFVNVFNSTSSFPATRKWVKGELSNFHYLMLVNTMAGRTFNDLTQYPVFPWVLADYTSEELDLDNPRSFRDLSKPMGCQTPERQAEFRDRYQSFSEMGDQPPFHYGTHYSSAMIVTSYLIRLRPFVQSYLLLQGGTFDHADRLFYSIEKAWMSASRNNMTDVRELTPEFFYLPEFLTNANGFDFGLRQGTDEPIDNVALPPWAKGDPKIFVAKNREALESPYVSKHLHEWIDLVFGFKQRGEAALEATNVFHHLSYHGARNIDDIEDPVERLATIGIIHNFGQTPHQVFQRAHPQRDETRHKPRGLDTAAKSLTRLPFPILESNEKISSLQYSTKHERLLYCSAFRLNMPPDYDKCLEWGFADRSVRFYSKDSGKLNGLFEQLHQGQLSNAIFADSRTLITAGMDCTISVWSVKSTSKAVDLHPKSCLFGHRTPVTVLALSRSFSTFLSASLDGHVLLWDLNRLEFLRKLTSGGPVECARINDVNGNIMLCRGQRVTLYTLNGELILDQSACDSADDQIMSCAFYEGQGNEWLERDLLFTGHKRGVVNVWSKAIHANGTFVLELVKRLNHVDNSREEKMNFAAAMTQILPMPQAVYTGDESGRVVSAFSF
ncbi:MAG: hypothetical protein M1819_004596 [Sarea resinae]|nr:MAG: hypothetical protein M1819_006801 [Sarea resinae]KAI9828271.1 MAG: hypothetical protein M1819_006609 [Sarea resinae]KAI9832052.1 MAG: hypothetical protein M1819_004596 [Sarea resinae]